VAIQFYPAIVEDSLLAVYEQREAARAMLDWELPSFTEVEVPAPALPESLLASIQVSIDTFTHKLLHRMGQVQGKLIPPLFVRY
jgi:hypothetical protein